MPTLVSTTELTWSGTSSPRTSASITVAVGDYLCVKAGGSVSNGALTVSDSQGLTWSSTSRTDSGYNPVFLMTSTAVGTAGTLTVTVTRASGSNYWGAEIEVWRGALGFGTPVTGIGSSGAPSLAITTTAANAAISYLNSDNNGSSVSGRAWRTINSASPTEQEASTPGVTVFVGSWTDAGAAGSKTTGLTTPSSQKWAAIAVEVLAPALARTDTVGVGITDTATADATATRTDTVGVGITDTATLAMISNTAATNTVGIGITASASIRTATSRADLVRPWDSPDRDDWPRITRTAQWERDISARIRTITGWGELVDLAGRPVQIMTDTGRPRWRLPLAGASVTYNAEQLPSWSARLAFAHPWLIPTTGRHPLWGASPWRIRLWWSIWSPSAGTWWSKPVCTLAIGDTAASDTGVISGTIDGRDVLSTMVGYGRGAPNVVGMTVDRAISTIIARSAPALQARIVATTVTVPEGTVLRDPLRDVADLAAIGWTAGVVRSDDQGLVYAGPRPTSTDTPLAWTEGRGNPVSQIDWAHGVTAMGNQVTGVSTHPDAVGLTVTRQDDDPTSPTYVGGPWGVHPLKSVESSVATTSDALTAVVDAALDVGLHPTEDARLRIPQRPDLYGWRRARVARRPLGMADVAQVASWTMALPVPGVDPEQMTVGLMQRQV